MTDLFKTVALSLLTPKCYDQYFVKYDFFDGECMKATISKGLGLVITVASVTVKAPQIIKIVNAKSGEGITLLGTMLELLAVTSFFGYSYLRQFPFSAWGDGLFMAIQTAIIVALIFHYKNQKMQLFTFLTVYLAFVFGIVTKLIPVPVFWFLQVLNLPILILGKGIQVVANYKNQSTGQLSVITYFMLFGGAAARVFTSVQETGDSAIIVSFVFATILNGIILFQILFYSKATEAKEKAKKGKSKGKKTD